MREEKQGESAGLTVIELVAYVSFLGMSLAVAYPPRISSEEESRAAFIEVGSWIIGEISFLAVLACLCYLRRDRISALIPGLLWAASAFRVSIMMCPENEYVLPALLFVLNLALSLRIRSRFSVSRSIAYSIAGVFVALPVSLFFASLFSSLLA